MPSCSGCLGLQNFVSSSRVRFQPSNYIVRYSHVLSMSSQGTTNFVNFSPWTRIRTLDIINAGTS